ncbi:MAG: hypothetical protein ABII21_00245 [bacterium]
MADQDAQDIKQMMSGSTEVKVAAPKKSKLLWIVLGCVVVGVGLGIFVYQQSLTPSVKPSPTPKPVVTTVTPKPSPVASPVVPAVSLVEAQPKTVAFPKAGKIRVYYRYFPAPASWNPLGIIVKEGAGGDSFTAPGGAVTTPMQIVDTGYTLSSAATLTINSYLGTNSSQLSIGWANPVSNKCGFNGFGVLDIASYVTWATTQAAGEPIVSVQCWGDYSPSPADTSAKDFNDYLLIWSYTPGASVSPSPSGSASPSPSSSSTASSSPSPSVAASSTLTPTPTPDVSPRVTMPDTSEGTPVTGVFEVTVGTVSVGLLLLVIGLLGLLAL